jgi:hypothetical protein
LCIKPGDCALGISDIRRNDAIETDWPLAKTIRDVRFVLA